MLVSWRGRQQRLSFMHAWSRIQVYELLRSVQLKLSSMSDLRYVARLPEARRMPSQILSSSSSADFCHINQAAEWFCSQSNETANEQAMRLRKTWATGIRVMSKVLFTFWTVCLLIQLVRCLYTIRSFVIWHAKRTTSHFTLFSGWLCCYSGIVGSNTPTPNERNFGCPYNIMVSAIYLLRAFNSSMWQLLLAALVDLIWTWLPVQVNFFE